MLLDARTGQLAYVSRHALTFFVASIPVVAWALELGVALTASHLLALFVIGLAGTVWVVLRRPPIIDLVTISLIAFVAVATMSVLRVYSHPDLVIFGESIRAKATKQLIGLWFAFGLFLALRYLLDTFRLGSHVLRAHFWTTVAIAGLALLQYGVALWDLSSPLAAFPVYNSTLGETRVLDSGVAHYGFPRVSLTLVEPSRLGTYLLTGWAFWLFAIELGGQGFLRGRRALFAGILLGAAVILTGSRSAYVVFIVVVIGALLFRPHRLYRLAVVCASIVLAGALVGPRETAGITASLVPAEVPEAVRDEASTPRSAAGKKVGLLDSIHADLVAFGTAANPSARHRIGSVIVALAVLREDPWWGAGYGTSEFAMVTKYPAKMGPILTRPLRPTMLGAYNTVLAETGLLGALCLAGLAIGAFLSVMRVAWWGTPKAGAVAWGLGAALGAYALAMTGLAVETYQFLLFWLLLSLSTTAAVASDAYPAFTARAGARERTAHPLVTFALTSDR